MIEITHTLSDKTTVHFLKVKIEILDNELQLLWDRHLRARAAYKSQDFGKLAVIMGWTQKKKGRKPPFATHPDVAEWVVFIKYLTETKGQLSWKMKNRKVHIHDVNGPLTPKDATIVACKIFYNARPKEKDIASFSRLIRRARTTLINY